MLSSAGQEFKMNYVIIGNGIAGVSAAESIRQFDPESSITIIGDETELPYYRPMISLVLEGTILSEKLPVRDQNFYDELNIQALLGERVEGPYGLQLVPEKVETERFNGIGRKKIDNSATRRIVSRLSNTFNAKIAATLQQGTHACRIHLISRF